MKMTSVRFEGTVAAEDSAGVNLEGVEEGIPEE